MEIRKAEETDIPELASLMEQLGYSTTVESMWKRWNNIAASSDYHTLVASDEGKVVAMIGLLKGFYFEMDGSYVRIVAFVVDSAYRGKGVGKKLLEEAENWAKEVGASGVGLNSGNRPERYSAHAFYKKMGYIDKSIGFSKSFG